MTFIVAVAMYVWASHNAFFETHERAKASEADTLGAQQALESRVPEGSTPDAYVRMFKSIGGNCDTGSSGASGNYLLRCTYLHGLVVQSQWIVIVRFDSNTNKSNGMSVSFGLTGL